MQNDTKREDLMKQCVNSSNGRAGAFQALDYGLDSLLALIRKSSSWLGHQALNLRTLVQIQPLVHGRVMKLVHVLASKARFCGFESHLCHQIWGRGMRKIACPRGMSNELRLEGYPEIRLYSHMPSPCESDLPQPAEVAQR